MMIRSEEEKDMEKKSGFRKFLGNVIYGLIMAAVYASSVFLIHYFGIRNIPTRNFVMVIIIILGAIGMVTIWIGLKWFGTMFLLSGIVGSFLDIYLQRKQYGSAVSSSGKVFIITMVVGSLLGAIIDGIRIAVKRNIKERRKNKALEEARKEVLAEAEAAKEPEPVSAEEPNE